MLSQKGANNVVALLCRESEDVVPFSFGVESPLWEIWQWSGGFAQTCYQNKTRSHGQDARATKATNAAFFRSAAFAGTKQW